MELSKELQVLIQTAAYLLEKETGLPASNVKFTCYKDSEKADAQKMLETNFKDHQPKDVSFNYLSNEAKAGEITVEMTYFYEPVMEEDIPEEEPETIGTCEECGATITSFHDVCDTCLSCDEIIKKAEQAEYRAAVLPSGI